METNKANTATPAPGFDLNGILNSPGLGELIKHLLSAGGAALFNYLMSIKPMQEKIEVLTKENKELKEKIEDAEDRIDELIIGLNKKFKSIEAEEEVSGNGEDYFIIKPKDRSITERKRKYLN